MKLLNKIESQKLDSLAINEYGLSESTLMESAGASVISLTSNYIQWDAAKVVVLCGTGNNGGDGFVAARYATLMGADVVIFIVGNISHLTKISQAYKAIVEKMKIPIKAIQKAEEAYRFLEDADIIVDALIGTGLTSAIKGEKAKLINRVNVSSAIRVSIDIPSGLVCDSGECNGLAIKADYTIAMGSIKRAHVLYPGCEYCGTILVSRIGIPSKADEFCKTEWVEKKDIEEMLPHRMKIGHKGNYGTIGIIAGSEGLEGAGFLTACGALYAGSGKVHLLVPGEIALSITGKVPEIMVSSIGEKNCFFVSDVEPVLQKLKSYNVVALGTGIGRHLQTQLFVKELLLKINGTVILDADALYAIASLHISLKELPGQFILTPHVGEFARLINKEVVEVEQNRIEWARLYAQENQVVLVLKGYPTVTATPLGEVFVNSTGNPGMATGGMGDVLTGVISSLYGQDMELDKAAVAGVYMHSLAADLLAEEKGVGFTASEVAEKIPQSRMLISENK